MTLVEEIAQTLVAERVDYNYSTRQGAKPHLDELTYWSEVAIPNALGGETEVTEELIAFSCLFASVVDQTRIVCIYDAFDLFERTFHVPTDKDVDFVTEAYWRAVTGLCPHHFTKLKGEVWTDVLPRLYAHLNCKGMVATLVTGGTGRRVLHLFFSEAADAMAFRLAL